MNSDQSLSLGEKVFWPDGRVSVVTERGLELTSEIDWRVTLAVEWQSNAEAVSEQAEED